MANWKVEQHNWSSAETPIHLSKWNSYAAHSSEKQPLPNETPELIQIIDK